MDKIWLIVKREYLSRVLKKSFLLVTLLTPLGIGLLGFLGGYLASGAGSSVKKAAVIDQSGVIQEPDFGDRDIHYSLVNLPLDSLKRNFTEKGYDLLIVVPPYNNLDSTSHQINYYSKEKLSIPTIESMEDQMEKMFADYKIKKSNIDKSTLDKLKIKIKLENAMLTEADTQVTGDKSSKFSSAIATALSYVMGFLMYMVIFVFGSMVMRSVMEEK